MSEQDANGPGPVLVKPGVNIYIEMWKYSFDTSDMNLSLTRRKMKIKV